MLRNSVYGLLFSGLLFLGGDLCSAELNASERGQVSRSCKNGFSSCRKECTSITCIPKKGLVITEPGCYKVVKELTYKGEEAAAITIEADDVSLDLGGFTLALSPDSVGIRAAGIKNFRLLNGSIISTAPSLNALSSSLFLSQVDDFIIERIRTDATFRGIKLQTCTNGRFIECVQENHGIGIDTTNTFGSRALRLDNNCQNISFDSCHYFNNVYAEGEPTLTVTRSIQIPDIASNIRFSDCLFENTQFTVAGVEGLLIENSVFVMNSPNYILNFLEIGLFADARGITVRNCSFTNSNAATQFDGINLFQCSNVLIEDCLIYANPSGINLNSVYPLYPASLIHLGGINSSQIQGGGPFDPSTQFAANVTLRNLTLCGGTADPTSPRALHAINVEPYSRDILIEGINISNFNSGSLPVIPNNPNYFAYGDPIKGGAIFVDGGATNVVIQDTVINGIASGPEGGRGAGHGILLSDAYNMTGFTSTVPLPATTNCTVANCTVTQCTGVGIFNESTPASNNLVVNNLSYHNSGGNYSGVPAGSIVNQGAPAVAGENMLP